MKKLTVALLLCYLQFSSYAQSQKELMLKVEYLPQHSYIQTITRQSHTEIGYKGSKEFLETLKERGKDNPTISDDTSVMVALSKTGKEINGNYPFSMEVTKSLSSTGKTSLSEGTKFFGKVPVGDFKMEFDSVHSEDMSEDVKKQIIPMMKNLMSQLSFPEKNVKVGETFSRETPISIPMGSITLDMAITTTYKLVRIVNDTANFDITQVYTMKTMMDDNKMKLTGDAKGRMTYDMKNNFYTTYQIALNMYGNMKVDDFSFDMKLKSFVTQAVVIKAD